MKVFRSGGHESHFPETYFLQGEFLPYTPDNPARAHNIAAALENAGHELVEPADFGLGPVAAVHTGEYLGYLETAWDEWRASGEALRQAGIGNDCREVYPLIFPVPGNPLVYPSSILGRAGYHAIDMWVPISQGTWAAARASANLAVAAADAVLHGEPIAYALCRPSGHHADAQRGGGNCYLNNAAIAAQHLRRKFRRVAVIDIDVHHGNGTQAIFYARDDVFFASIHCSPDDCYPYFLGYVHERGVGPGEGYNCNLPLPKGSGDEAFLKAVATAARRAKACSAEALVVSLGVDGHEADLAGEFKVTNAGLRGAGQCLRALGLPTVLVQEGGYNLETIGACLVSALEGFEAV